MDKKKNLKDKDKDNDKDKDMEKKTRRQRQITSISISTSTKTANHFHSVKARDFEAGKVGEGNISLFFCREGVRLGFKRRLEKTRWEKTRPRPRPKTKTMAKRKL